MQISKNALYVGILILGIATVLPLFREGLGAMSIPFKSSLWTTQYFVDLVMALCLVMLWMWQDCKRRGKNPLPWIGATLITGSFAPMIYLLVRLRQGDSSV